jgi:hypothetical protein
VNFALWPKENRATTAQAEETDDHHARNTIQHNQTVNFGLWPKKKIEQLLRLKKQVTIMLAKARHNQTVNFALWSKKKSSNDC